MPDVQIQGPPCTGCGSPMNLMAFEASETGSDLQTFSCPKCNRVQRHAIQSAVTEAWLDQKRENAITHTIKAGRMISKPA